jgi:hypothetical protein
VDLKVPRRLQCSAWGGEGFVDGGSWGLYPRAAAKLTINTTKQKQASSFQ